MDNGNEKEVLLLAWVKLEEIKNLTSTVLRGLDYEIKMETEEMRSVLRVVNKMAEDIINEMGESLS